MVEFFVRLLVKRLFTITTPDNIKTRERLKITHAHLKILFLHVFKVNSSKYDSVMTFNAIFLYLLWQTLDKARCRIEGTYKLRCRDRDCTRDVPNYKQGIFIYSFACNKLVEICHKFIEISSEFPRIIFCGYHTVKVLLIDTWAKNLNFTLYFRKFRFRINFYFLLPTYDKGKIQSSHFSVW